MNKWRHLHVVILLESNTDRKALSAREEEAKQHTARFCAKRRPRPAQERRGPGGIIAAGTPH